MTALIATAAPDPPDDTTTKLRNALAFAVAEADALRAERDELLSFVAHIAGHPRPLPDGLQRKARRLLGTDTEAA